MRRLAPRPALLLPLALLLALVGAPRLAADEVRLAGGTELEGVVLAEDEAGVHLLLPGGDVLRLAADDVAEVERDPDAPSTHAPLRFLEHDDGTATLEAALVHLVHPENGRRVDLVGMLHVADPAYYRAVQALLEDADVVLYEMVKPEDMSPTEVLEASTAEAGAITAIQTKLARLLALETQGRGLAYGRPHFVNADLTAEQIAAALGVELAEDGEGGRDLGARLLGWGVAIRLVGPALDLLALVGRVAPGLAGALKRRVAPVLAEMDTEMMLDDEQVSLLLHRRNAVVIDRLRELGGDVAAVAVPYGAAHLPDLERRLVEEEGFRRAGARWLVAWSMAPR